MKMIHSQTDLKTEIILENFRTLELSTISRFHFLTHWSLKSNQLWCQIFLSRTYTIFKHTWTKPYEILSLSVNSVANEFHNHGEPY